MTRDRSGSPRTKADIAFESIRDLLLSGEIAPGPELTYRRLAERLGMSQTPIREAVRRLEAEGLLHIEPHKGVSRTGIEDLSIDEAQDLYLVRMLLEREAARLAASRIEPGQRTALTEARLAMEQAARSADDPDRLRRLHGQWHFHVHRASGSPYLATLCASAWHRFPWEAVWVVPGRLDRSMEQHRVIESAILDGEAAHAAEAMEEHVETGRLTVLEHLRSSRLILGSE